MRKHAARQLSHVKLCVAGLLILVIRIRSPLGEHISAGTTTNGFADLALNHNRSLGTATSDNILYLLCRLAQQTGTLRRTGASNSTLWRGPHRIRCCLAHCGFGMPGCIRQR